MPSSSLFQMKQKRNRDQVDDDLDSGDETTTPSPRSKKPRKNTSSSQPRTPKSSPSKTPGSSSSKAKSSGSGSSPSKKDPFHVSKKYLKTKDDETILNFKFCIELHAHLLTGCFKSEELPTLPTPDEIEQLESKFMSTTNPYDVLQQKMSSINSKDRTLTKKFRQLRADCALAAGGTYASKIAFVPEHSIRVIFGLLKASGIEEWKPDILSSTPDSLYNQLHQHVFNKTLETTIINFGYRHLEVSFHHLENTFLLNKLYHNYVFSYWRILCKKEATETGAVEKALMKNKVYKRRIDRCKLRKEFQVKRAWPTRAQHLISEPSCHSDDENAPDGTLYILSMPRRSNKATTFIRGVEDFFDTTNKLIKRRNAYKRISRVSHPARKATELEGLPSPKVALDWHDPDSFNQLPACIRALYVDAPIALPLESVMAESDGWKDLKMSDKEFMDKYGNAVRALYQFPSEEEIYAMEHGALDEDSEAEEDNGYDSDDEDGKHGNGDEDDVDMEEDEEDMEEDEENMGEDEDAAMEEEEAAEENGGAGGPEQMDDN
ncbi:hypothetical protein BT96DRAFT_944218 [Gymnopus androsaceus JB14]|uniref:Uncharacterized protein n=1 Tax=Gymnopus androsaceus JB14 TaxID=1447944 RepID=A0A6A4H4D1_9AGAR|nr:hypothetical protein BT96DRAFT_944218 [Gymnopus androsaceus JB14]